MPLDAQADLPDRCYSYLLQEIRDYLSIRDAFDEPKATLEKVLGLKISSSRFEVLTWDTSTSYDEFYEHKSSPSPESAYRVYNKMGFGFLESVYEKCLLIELRKAGLDTESQKSP